MQMGGGSLLQAGKGDKGMDEYVQESANALSESLGPRWEASKLEKAAKENREALLQGIAGHNKA